MSQSQKVSYQAVDDATGKEVVGLEFRTGLMSEELVLANEAKLLPVFVQFISEAQKSAVAK